MLVSNCNNIPGGCGTPVNIDQWDIANEGNYLSGLTAVPANGTFIETVGNSNTFEIVGGAPMLINDCSTI